MKKRTVLITGANGQVGREIVNHFFYKEIPLIPMDRKALDISDISMVKEVILDVMPCLVINPAAYTAVDAAENEKKKAFEINAEGVKNLALICSSLSIPMFHISTDYVFDGEKKGSYKENDPPSPQGVYAKSKLLGENLIREILREHIILRISWVFGRCGNNFVKTILRLAKEKKELRMVSDQRGCPTPAQDVAWVLGILAERYFHKNELPWGTYHYAGRPDTTWYHLSKAVLEEAYALGMLERMPSLLAITTEEYPTPAKRPRNSTLNCNKIYKTFGIKSRPWRLGLVETLKEIKEKMP